MIAGLRRWAGFVALVNGAAPPREIRRLPSQAQDRLRLATPPDLLRIPTTRSREDIA